MAVSEKSTRVQMTLQRGLVEKIDALCERANISRSTWIEYTLGMAVDSYEGVLNRTASAVALESSADFDSGQES